MPETKKQTIAGLQREIERLKALLRAATSRQDATYRAYGPEQDVHIARLTVLDDIISNLRRLRAVTLCTAEQFDYSGTTMFLDIKCVHPGDILIMSNWAGHG